MEFSQNQSSLSISDLKLFARWKTKLVICDERSRAIEKELQSIFKRDIHFLRDIAQQTNVFDLKTIAVGENLDHLDETVVLKAVGHRAIKSLIDEETNTFPTNGHFYTKSFSLSEQKVFLLLAADHTIIQTTQVLQHNGEVTNTHREATVVVFSTVDGGEQLSTWLEVRDMGAAFFTPSAFSAALDVASCFEDLLEYVSEIKIFTGLRFHLGSHPAKLQKQITRNGGIAAQEDEYGIWLVMDDETPENFLRMHSARPDTLNLVQFEWLDQCLTEGTLLPLSTFQATLPPLPKFHGMNPKGLRIFSHSSLSRQAKQSVRESMQVLGMKPAGSLSDAFGVIADPFHGDNIAVSVPIRNQYCLEYMRLEGAHECSYFHKCFAISDALRATIRRVEIKGMKADAAETQFIEALVKKCVDKESKKAGREIVLWDGEEEKERMTALMKSEDFQNTKVLVVSTRLIKEALEGSSNKILRPEDYVIDINSVSKSTKRAFSPPPESQSRRVREKVSPSSSAGSNQCVDESLQLRKLFAIYMLMKLIGPEVPLQLEIGDMVAVQHCWMSSCQSLESLKVTFDANISALGTGIVNEFSSFVAAEAHTSILVAGVYYDVTKQNINNWALRFMDEVTRIYGVLGVVGVHARKRPNGYELIFVRHGEPIQLLVMEMSASVVKETVSANAFFASKFWIPSDKMCYCKQPMKFDMNFRAKWFHSDAGIPRELINKHNLVYRATGPCSGTLLNSVSGQSENIFFRNERDFERIVGDRILKQDKLLKLCGSGKVLCERCSVSVSTHPTAVDLIKISESDKCSRCGAEEYENGTLVLN